MNRQKLEARLSVKRNSATSITISSRPKEDTVRSLARKGLEATFKVIFEDVKERPKVYKIDPAVDLNEPKAMAEKVEKELFDNLAIAKGDGQRPECGEAVCFSFTPMHLGSFSTWKTVQEQVPVSPIQSQGQEEYPAPRADPEWGSNARESRPLLVPRVGERRPPGGPRVNSRV
jgi:hypothetical protein